MEQTGIGVGERGDREYREPPDSSGRRFPYLLRALNVTTRTSADFAGRIGDIRHRRAVVIKVNFVCACIVLRRLPVYITHLHWHDHTGGIAKIKIEALRVLFTIGSNIVHARL